MTAARPQHNWYCRTGKVLYDTQDDALAALGVVRSQRHRNPNRQERRVYLCVYCQRWHLTTRRYKAQRRQGAKR